MTKNYEKESLKKLFLDGATQEQLCTAYEMMNKNKRQATQKLMSINLRVVKKEDVEKLLDTGADINVQDGEGRTLLMDACFYGREDLVKLALDRKANINLEDKEGKTAFMYAEESQNKKILKMMEEARASEMKVHNMQFYSMIMKLHTKDFQHD